MLPKGSAGRMTAGLVAAMVLIFAIGCESTSDDATPPSGDGPGRLTSTEAGEPTDPGSCDGPIGAKPVDHVRVPEGATCRLDGTRVDGNISVGHGATLVARGVTVDGDVEAEGARSVEVSHGSHIGGNVQGQRGGSVLVTSSRIDGDLAWEELSGRLIAQGNAVGGNLEADRNSGPVTIAGNKVDGDLTCEENHSVRGGRNTVRGNRESQCHRL